MPCFGIRLGDERPHARSVAVMVPAKYPIDGRTKRERVGSVSALDAVPGEVVPKIDDLRAERIRVSISDDGIRAVGADQDIAPPFKRRLDGAVEFNLDTDIAAEALKLVQQGDPSNRRKRASVHDNAHALV